MDAITAITPSASKSENAAATLAGDLDAFLLLLTAQLQNQDPLSPLEPTEFTNQLVQFAGVEQAIATNSNLEGILSLQTSTFAAAVLGFIGKDITAQSNQLPLQDGDAEFEYSFPEQAQNVVITISDQNGNVILTEAGVNTPGEHDYVWDGKDANDVQQPDGPYKISVTAVGADQEILPVTIITTGRVTGIGAENGLTVLEMDGVGVPLDSVLSVNEPKEEDQGGGA